MAARVSSLAKAVLPTRLRDNRSIEEYFIESFSVGMTAAMLGLAQTAGKRQPTIGRANSKYSKCLFCMGNFLK